jgi:hypothetical protein
MATDPFDRDGFAAHRVDKIAYAEILDVDRARWGHDGGAAEKALGIATRAVTPSGVAGFVVRLSHGRWKDRRGQCGSQAEEVAPRLIQLRVAVSAWHGRSLLAHENFQWLCCLRSPYGSIPTFDPRLHQKW